MGCLPLNCDMTDYDATAFEVQLVGPELVAHLAGISDVDYCEDKAHREEVIKTNYRGTANLASICNDRKIPMVFLSTDHIFNGKKGPYRENYPYWHKPLLGKFEEPVNYYGFSKMAAEGIARVFPMKIVRTSYLFDKDRMKRVMEKGQNFPTFLSRSFMYVEHFAESFYRYLERFYSMPDVLHISGSQTISWYEFVLAYASIFGINKEGIVPRTKEIKGHAPRPHKAGLRVNLSAKLGLPQYSYLDGLKQMKEER